MSTNFQNHARSEQGEPSRISFFITLEGGEGVGKSTALACIKKYFQHKKIDCVFTREPGGTAIAESIRDILLHNTDETILPETELLLMFASRMQHIAHVIKPALQAGKTVVSDRFTDASFAYQGGGRGVSLEKLQTITNWVQGDLEPNLTLLFDAPVDIGLSRIDKRGNKDRIEKEKIDFFQRVRDVYLARAKQFPQRFVIIDATQSLLNVEKQIVAALNKIV